jgi:hypothetical protein
MNRPTNPTTAAEAVAYLASALEELAAHPNVITNRSERADWLEGKAHEAARERVGRAWGFMRTFCVWSKPSASYSVWSTPNLPTVKFWGADAIAACAEHGIDLAAVNPGN